VHRRDFLKTGAAVIGASALARVPAQAQAVPDKVRVGYAITMSGPLAPGAQMNTISQYTLWQKRVNDSGGIALKKYGKKVPVELVSYDDRGQPDELNQATGTVDRSG